LAERLSLEIRIAHYPPYCSKHNPIEHLLFPHITRACQGVVLHSVDIAKRFMKKPKVTGRDSHPLKNSIFSRRTIK
jgi:hypothetical protein